MSIKICKRQRRGIDITQPELRGTLPECLNRAGIGPGNARRANVFAVRWYRGQMRAWAGWWRDSLGYSLYDKSKEHRCAETVLHLAVHYRDLALNLERELKGGAS